MKISNEQYASALYQALQEVTDKHYETVIENFIRVLSGSGDLARYEQIITAYEELDRKERGVAKADLTFARKTEVNKEFMNSLNKLAEKKLEVTANIDESIIGGVVVKIDDILLDASVKSRLRRLKQELSK